MHDAIPKKKRTQLQQEKSLFIERFYIDWIKYTEEYEDALDVKWVRRSVCSEGNVRLTWVSPKFMKHKGATSKLNYLNLTLKNPEHTNQQLVFEVEVEIHLKDNHAHVHARQFSCPINPSLNIHKSIILTKLLIALSGIIRQNKLETAVSRTVVSILDSMQAGELVMDSELYQW